MDKTMIMERLDHKETTGSYRYGTVTGSLGISSLYIRKESVTEKPPKHIRVQVTEAVGA